VVTPLSQISNVCFQRQLLAILREHKIRFKRRL
jgi:hypothetical protein